MTANQLPFFGHQSGCLDFRLFCFSAKSDLCLHPKPYNYTRESKNYSIIPGYPQFILHTPYSKHPKLQFFSVLLRRFQDQLQVAKLKGGDHSASFQAIQKPPPQPTIIQSIHCVLLLVPALFSRSAASHGSTAATLQTE